MRADWQPRKLRDVCELINGRAYSKPELLAEGKYPVLRVGNFFTNDHWYYSDMELEPKKYCDKGDLLYAWSASFGPRIWTGEKVIFHYHIWKVQPSPLIDKRFLFMWFLWDTEQIKADQGTGTTMIHVAKGSMEDRVIHVPPLPEQRRIVGILDEAFEGIATARANAEKNLENARALFESYLQSVFTAGRNGWEEKTIEEVCIIGDGNHSSNYPRKDELVEIGVPFIRATNLVAGRVSGEDMRFLSPEKHEQLKKGHLKTGDILITNRGEIGKTALVDATYDNANLNSQIAWLRCREGMVNKFLFHVLNSGDIQSHFEATKSGAALQQFTIKQLKALRVPSPPKSEQLAIVGALDSLDEQTDRLASIYQQKLAALDELKKSLLHQAFSGEL